MFFLLLLCGTILVSGQLERSFASDTAYSLQRNNHFQKRSPDNIKKRPCEISNDLFEGRVNTTDRLRRLRLRMKAGGFHAYIVPSVDEHQSEFIADYDKRREFISGFSGSAGTAVVLANVAALWTDGRYFIQAANELDCNWLLMKSNEKDTPTIYDWIIQNLAINQIVGADAKLIPYSEWMFLKDVLERSNITLADDNGNMIDDIWDIPQGRTPESVAHISVHDIKYAGKSWEDKIKDLLQILNDKNVEGTILSALDEIAWLFNLRGRDVPHTPVFKAYAFVSNLKKKIYIKKLKVTSEVQQHLCPKNIEAECVQIEEYSQAFQDMKKMINHTKSILVSSSSSYAVVNLIPEVKIVLSNEPSPVSTLKVIKNPVEISGMKNAALKDSVAIVDFIAMLENQVKLGKHWDEIKASKTLSRFRREQESNQGDSFETISAFSSNAAIIHYSPQVLTNRNINTKHLYLLDTGGQYYDGTTDITRTFHFGQPSMEEKEAYTRVLMGAIDLMATVFPENTKGVDLDIIARKPLYDIGLDYQHGTGHGIGYFLSVHEGPIYIGERRNNLGGTSLEPGMFLSDEPGYYEAGKFGIRLETMMVVVNAATPHNFNGEKFYTFEPVSFVPFEPNLIDLQVLNTKQKEWLNWYNTKVRNTVGIELKKQGRDRGLKWLLSKTEHIPVDVVCNHSPTLFSTYISVTLICLTMLVFQKFI